MIFEKLTNEHLEILLERYKSWMSYLNDKRTEIIIEIERRKHGKKGNNSESS
jgi:predicted Fe-S protein YdhL (DUF1289 family)